MAEVFDISGWKRIQAKKFSEREVRRKALLKQALEKVHQYFISKRAVEEVYLTGSLLQENRFHKYSDIDIAVKGLPEIQYIKTKVELEKLLNVTVDLIELENCSFPVRDRFADKKMIIENGLKIL